MNDALITTLKTLKLFGMAGKGGYVFLPHLPEEFGSGYRDFLAALDGHRLELLGAHLVTGKPDTFQSQQQLC